MLHQMLHKQNHQLVIKFLFQGSHVLEKYMNIEGFLDIEVLEYELWERADLLDLVCDV